MPLKDNALKGMDPFLVLEFFLCLMENAASEPCSCPTNNCVEPRAESDRHGGLDALENQYKKQTYGNLRT